MGFEVKLVGRKLPESLPVNRVYKTHCMRLLFRKGACFYAEYNIRLFLHLLFHKADVLLANDLDSLVGNYYASKIKRCHLVYDSHEYFTEVPELINRPRVKQVWESIEKRIVPKLKHAYTVCDSIAKIYTEKYGVDFKVVRNVPTKRHYELKSQNNKPKVILYQGAVNTGRGLENMIRAMKYIEDVKLIIVGDGDIKPFLEKQVSDSNLQNKIEFTGRLPINQLAELTPKADLGLSVEEDLGLNYHFALPNKLFDYIQAQVPVLVTNLPEMAAIVNRYNIGVITDTHAPEKLAMIINKALNNKEKRSVWKKNLQLAAKELIWEQEEKILRDIFLSLNHT
jgi:glycosyltransferase involved in cell wall biosynthesis